MLQQIEQRGAVLSADVDEQRAGVGGGPAVVHVVERMIESVEQQVANCPEWGERQMRRRRCLAEQLEEFPIVGDRTGDALVDR